MSDPATAPRHAGRCLCGEVRFRFDGAPLVAGYCHCGLCRRATGAPVVALAVFPRATFRLLGGDTATHPSSSRGLRHFCAACGSPLFFEPLDTPNRFEVYLGVLDDPAAITPAFHIWTDDRLPWLHLDDDLRRFPGHRPHRHGES